MCDTMVALGALTQDGKVLFAKNSDRSPNEPLITVHFPAKDYDLNSESEVKLTYITIPQVKHTYEVVLMKPSWMWGAEMGFNQFGLNIGNEAVFTKEKYGKESLLGMDMLRLALERTKDASSALNFLIDLLAQYGQGGNCGFNKKFHYHNSFLIADSKEAYVLETAGIYYVAKKVKDVYAISNCLSIENDYDMIHKDAIDNAIAKKYCKSKEEFGFASCYSDKLFTFFAKSKNRRAQATKSLTDRAGRITFDAMKNILRCHAPNKKEDKNSVGSICMHAGGLIGDHTTGSYIAEIGENEQRYLITGSSLACLSIFKPYILGFDTGFIKDDETLAKEYWLKSELLHRYIIAGQIDKENFLQEKNKLEKKYLTLFSNANNLNKRKEVIGRAWAEANALTERFLKPLKGMELKFSKGSLMYRNYWKKKTKILIDENSIKL